MFGRSAVRGNREADSASRESPDAGCVPMELIFEKLLMGEGASIFSGDFVFNRHPD